MPHDSDPRHEYERERRIKVVRSELDLQERTTRISLFYLSIVAVVALLGMGICLVNL